MALAVRACLYVGSPLRPAKPSSLTWAPLLQHLTWAIVCNTRQPNVYLPSASLSQSVQLPVWLMERFAGTTSQADRACLSLDPHLQVPVEELMEPS